MSRSPKLVLVSADAGLIAHWQRAFGVGGPLVVSRFSELTPHIGNPDIQVWVDLSVPDVPAWSNPVWASLTQPVGPRLVAASSNPKDGEAILALDSGCAGYCHAYSDVGTLKQVRQVVQAGHVWIGKTLMQRLLSSASRAGAQASAPHEDWSNDLTPREREVAILAANGASNLVIARDCKISERTVKAHLSAVFTKLNITDRLQLALRVHGIS